MCRVFVSGRGNVFMREIAEHLVEALVLAGRPSELVIDELPDGDGDPLQQLVVAPHELFVLSSASEPERMRSAAAAMCVNTEQPGTKFFDLAMTYASRGPVVLDINRFALDAVRRRGLVAVHLPLGCTPSMDAWGGSADHRGTDIAFMAGRTRRREQFIGGAGGLLWEWATDLRFFSWHQPVHGDDDSFAAGAAKLNALADTRILLNVHRGDEPYFEWARVVEAVANGCVVASETSVGFEPLVPGVHFLMAPYEQLAEQAVALALDESRRMAMAEAAYKLTTTELSQAELLQAALTEATVAAGGGHRGARGGRLPRARRHQPAAPSAKAQALRKVISEAKLAYLDQLELSRSIEATISLVEHGDADHATVSSTPAWTGFEPDISVVVPLFNQGRYLAEAVHSVIAASAPGTPRAELIIVDDHSTDGSLDVAQKLLAEIAWYPATVVARSANGGVSAARNTGVEHARAAAVFMLDADDVIYPTALTRLHQHLGVAPDDVVAAYGLVERFDTTGALGLSSHLPWDPQMLVRGSYIESMAMHRRSSWVELGGSAMGAELFANEHFDLYLSIAERGWRADLLRSIIGRSRQHPTAMRVIGDVDPESTFVTARHRHPRLPWPS